MTDPATPVLRHALSADRMTLVIERGSPCGRHVVTLHRQPQAGPFTDADIAAALSQVPASGNMQPGQRNRTRRTKTSFGTVWTHLMLGPPTWWRPKLRREQDGTVMAGWLRLAVAVKLDRNGGAGRAADQAHRPASGRIPGEPGFNPAIADLQEG